MTPDATTLVVVADGHRARLLEQLRLDGPLHDRPDWLAGLKQHHDHEPHSHIPHDGDLRDRAELAFIKDLAHKLEEVARDHPFEQMILIAPPRALGKLRDALSTGLTHKVTGSDSHERLDATLITLQDVVHVARRAEAA